MIKQAHFRVTGHVQGVFFRAHARDQAAKLHLKGRIGNHKDGSVEAVLLGREESLKDFYKWAQQGSPSSKVEKVEMKWLKPNPKTNTETHLKINADSRAAEDTGIEIY